jgi:hypothetical protein
MAIEPIGTEPPQGFWTEFREAVAPQEAPTAPLSEAAAFVSTAPIIATASASKTALSDTVRSVAAYGAVTPIVVNGSSVAPTNGATHQPTDMDADDAGRLVAQVGDLVVVRYHDDPNRAVRVRISRIENKPDVGIIHTLPSLWQKRF